MDSPNHKKPVDFIKFQEFMERYYKSLSLTSDFYHKWLFGDVKILWEILTSVV